MDRKQIKPAKSAKGCVRAGVVLRGHKNEYWASKHQRSDSIFLFFNLGVPLFSVFGGYFQSYPQNYVVSEVETPNYQAWTPALSLISQAQTSLLCLSVWLSICLSFLSLVK